MPELKIKKFPDPALKVKAKKVGKVTQSDKAILSDMVKTMYMSQGVGLAAVQVGIDKQFAVIDVGTGLITMINPVITKREGSETEEEGCLSCPGTCVKIKRAKKVVVTFLNENGDIMELRAEGLLARAIQHELDHLSGRLILDYLSPIKKMLAKKKIVRNG